MNRFFIVTAILFLGIYSTNLVAGEAPEPLFDPSESNMPSDDNKESQEQMLHADHFLDNFVAKEIPIHGDEPKSQHDTTRQEKLPNVKTQLFFDVPKKLDQHARLETIVHETTSIPEDEFIIIKRPRDTQEHQRSTTELTDQQRKDDKHWKMLGKLLGKILAKLITQQLDHIVLKKSSNIHHNNKKQQSIHLKKFKQLMRKLSTKEKEEVANIWLRSRKDSCDAQLLKLQTQLKKAKVSTILSFHTKNRLIHDTNHLIKAQKTRFNQERLLFHDDMQNSLAPHETLLYHHKKMSWTIKSARSLLAP